MPLTSGQLALLKTELTTDPLALGYNAKLTIGDDTGVANILNTIGPANDGRYSVPNEPVSISALKGAITPLDLGVMTTTQVNNMSFLLNGVSTLDISTHGGNNLANVLAQLPNNGTSRVAIQGLSVRQGSRAEVLFSVNGVVVTANDVSNAMS